MEKFNFEKHIQKIVADAQELKDKHLDYKNIPVNYACIFAHSEEEYAELNAETFKIGRVLKDTPSGFLFQIKPLKTVAGNLQLLKIRKPDPTRPERGDADFTIVDFETFKNIYLNKPGYKLIQKEGFVMIELFDPKSDVRVYFSNPPLDKQFNLV